MSDIRQWLEELRLGQYADAFEENDIEESLLPDLTDEALVKLGVASMGHRMKLLRAFAAQSGAGLESAEAAKPRTHEPGKPSVEAERRQITVMFCDLVGSTALSERLDPEDLREVMTAYRKAAGAVIERYDGHVAQYLGDGLMSYFGWPRAHEDDAGRAIRAGLDIIEAVKGVDGPEPLRVRIGVATGPVVVGEGKDDDARASKLAVGETPNLASRLQGLAEPDKIVIADSTHRLAGGAFEYTNLGEKALKGVVEPVATWKVEGLARTAGRFEAAAGLNLTPFVGREGEISLILRRWENACEGDGQVVAVCGEAGIGKSRILRELQSRLAGGAHETLRFQCSPYHTNAPLHPFVEELSRTSDFDRKDSTDHKCDKLEAYVVARGMDPSVTMPLLALVLSLDTGSRYPAINLSAQKQKEETLATLSDLVLAMAADRPLFVIFEDTHWIDPTSQEVLNLIVAGAERQRVLIVVAHRPEYIPPWTGLGHIMPLTLTRLGRRQAAEMVGRVTGGLSLPDEVLDQIVAKTDGVPLFVEELTKTVIESGLVTRSDGEYVLTGPLSDLAIPSTLQDSLMARLDRIAPVREVAQIGACIGREFSHELLASISPMSDNALNEALQQLVSSELIYAVGTPPDATYTFKHALIQDAAYESLLRRRRRELHFTIAETLAKTEGTEPAVLASHYTKAETPDLAVPRWLEAGRKATAAAQYRESIAHLKNGIAILDGLKSDTEKVRLEIELQTALGYDFVVTEGYGSPQVRVCLDRSEALLPEAHDDEIVLPALLGLGIYHWVQGRLRLAVKYFEDLEARAKRCDNELMIFAAQSEYRSLLVCMGQAKRASALLRDMLDSYDPEKHGLLAVTAGQDYMVLGMYWLASADIFLGYPDRATAVAPRALAIAEELKHPLTIAQALLIHAHIAASLRNPDEAIYWAERCIDYCEEQRVPFYAGGARQALGLGLAMKGRADEGIAEIELGLAEIEEDGSPAHMLDFLPYWAEAHLIRGDADLVLSVLPKNLDTLKASGQVWVRPAMLILLGKAWLQHDPPDTEKAASYFQLGLDEARAQDGKQVELHAATSLARLRQSQGKCQEAWELLAPVYDWFTEGFDTADLKEAKTLLEELQ